MSLDFKSPECDDPATGALLVSYVLGTLPENDLVRFELHLLQCSACQQEMEAAAPALESLAATREEFVKRAHKEGEDFDSQYVRLLRDKQVYAKDSALRNIPKLIESIWEALWSRKWIIGTAGTVVVALLFTLRQGPEPVEPAKVQVSPNLLHKGMPKALSPAEPEQKTGSDSTVQSSPPAPMLQEWEVTETTTVGSQIENVEKPALSSQVRESAQQEAGKSEGESLQDIIRVHDANTNAALEEIESPLIAAEERASYIGQELVITATVPDQQNDLNRLADLALGKFDPAQFSDSYSIQESALPESVQKRMLDEAEYRNAAPGEPETNPDSLMGKGQYLAARQIYESKWKADSTDMNSLVMAGVTALAQGDNVGSRTALELAYFRLSHGEQKYRIGLLLARVDILAGELDNAKLQLAELAGSEENPERKDFAQKAIARIDSLANNRMPKDTLK